MLMAISIGPSSMSVSTHRTSQPIRKPHSNPDDDQLAEAQQRVHGGWRHAGDEDRNGRFQRQQSGGVVHQALAFQDVDERRGSPIRRAIAVAAIASVVETTAPSTNPVRQSKDGRMNGAKTRCQPR